ncbi:MAG TPA: alpha/beta fold hydrolase [Gemmataceae bacterium]|nr:alpha/beta fold hydrolase [Gemmataceae bacterium]
MAGFWRNWLEGFQLYPYARRQPLVLLNGLAEQAESWFRNLAFWRRHFDVYMPNLLVYDGAALHQRIDEGLPINVNYLVEQLHHYLESFVQTPPYHLVAASLGGKVAVEYASRYPERIARLVLLCPSGMGDEERLPIVDGVRRNDPRSIVESVFYDPDRVDPRLLLYYRRQLANRRWRLGLLRTVRGTMNHCVRELLAELPHPALMVSGRDDKIVDPRAAEAATKMLPHGHYVCIPRCGHAPQMERSWTTNRLVLQFLTSNQPSTRTPLSHLLQARPTLPQGAGERER